MSLRWKLFRFLRFETLLSPSQPDASDPDIPLFPSLAAPTTPTSPREALLRKLCTAAARALHADTHDGLHAVALPRAVVQLFYLKPGSPSTPPPVPPHLSFSPHDTAVVAVQLCPVLNSANPPWLVTLGHDDGGATVKIWAFNVVGTSSKTGAPPTTAPTEAKEWEDAASNVPDVRPECVANFRLQGDARPTALAVSSGLQHLSVGFTDGSVTVFSGELPRGRATRTRVAPAPGEMIEARPVVFLEYASDLLFAVSELSVFAITPFSTPEGRSGFRRDVLENLGASSLRMCCVLQQSAELVVGKDEALYFFNRDGRGQCLAFPSGGERAMITAVGNYVIHSTGQGATTAYDVVNKLIAYRGKGDVSCAFPAPEQSEETEPSVGILLCFSEGFVHQLTEISLEDRVNMLLKRGLYVPAISLARAESSRMGSSSMLTRALRQYAEYLMTKDRYDDAAEQLTGTIGGEVEPSWVITRLVEQPGLRSGLRLYLEALHAAGRAAFAHTKVLITCYRHDRTRGAILGSKATEKTADEYVINVFSDVDWTEEQVDAAIVLCRDAGLYKVAERVARRRGRYVQLARTLVEDLEETSTALELLRTIPESEAVKAIRAVGRQILVKDSASFVAYLSDAICRSTAEAPQGREHGPVLKLYMFLPLFIDMPRWRASLLQRILSRPGGISQSEARKAWILLFESLVCVDLNDRVALPERPALKASEETGKSLKDEAADQASPDLNPRAPSTRQAGRRAIGRRALKILQSRWSVIDLRAALKVAEQYGHEPCLEYLYEHLRMYKELGMALRASANGQSLLRACRRHGEREPSLWLEAIRLFTPLAAEECGRDRSESPVESNRDDAEDGERQKREDRRPRRSSIYDNNECTENKEDGHGSEPGTDDLMPRGPGGEYMRHRSETEGEKTSMQSAQDTIDEAMQMLDRSGALSPLEIISVVTDACPDGAWGVVREYFERVCTSLRKEAASAEHDAVLLATELNDLRKETHRLSEETVVIKPKTCAMCEDAISVPAVHFFCGHSYHAACLAPGGGAVGGGSSGGVGVVVGSGTAESKSGDDRQGVWAEECPKCSVELDAMVSMRQAVEERNSRHEEFFAGLKGARDGFASIVEALERSPFL